MEFLRNLGLGARILDLGCAQGSFPRGELKASIIRTDIERHEHPADSEFVQADAAHLPFAPDIFDAVISNHSLEHIADADAALSEIGRVIGPSGLLYIAVPDASTITDKVYRWLGRGGGHVNAFTSASALEQLIAQRTGLPHLGTVVLYSGLSFLNRKNRKGPAPRRSLVVGGGYECTLRLATWLFRQCDRWFGTRLSIYGWAMYFGETTCWLDLDQRSNVCIRCGSGHAAASLRWRRIGLVRTYECPVCGTRNWFTPEVASKA